MQIKSLAALAIVPALFTAPQIVSVENLASVGWASPVEAGPTLKEGVRLNRNRITNRPRNKNVPTPRLHSRCPDPALYEIHIRPHGRSADGSHRFLVSAIIKNVGRATYKSKMNQQTVVLRFGSRVLNTSGWRSRSYNVNMAPGQTASGGIYVFNNWNPRPSGFVVFSARLHYASDINLDGNPQNDDCRSSNNSKRLSVREVNRKLRIPGF